MAVESPVDILHPSALESASSQTASIKVKSANQLEMWVNISAEVSGDFDFILETSVDNINFEAQATVANVVAVSTIAEGISRRPQALGLFARIRWVRNAGTMTFDARLLRKEG